MNFKLNVYTDDSMCEVKRVAEADALVVPYRVSMWLLASLDDLNLDDNEALLKTLAKNTDKIDKIVKATFKVSETELECIDTMELIVVIKELYAWVLDKVKNLRGNEKNVEMPVSN